MDTTLPTTDTPEQRSGVSRRTIVAGAAWAVPAIVAVTATPAFAASGPTVTATTPNMRVPAAGTAVVTAVVRNASGSPLAGQAVSFTGPSGTSFSPSSATTNSSGAATSTLTTTDTWATPGSTVTATVVSNGITGTAPLTVLGANAYLVGDNSAAAAPGGSTLTTPTQLKLAFPSPIKTMTSLFRTSIGSLFALLHDGSVWSIGDNSSGQLGDGSTTARSTWMKIPSLANVVQIATLETGTVLALLSDGTLRGWGLNDSGQLNDGTSTNRYTPVTITGLGSVGIAQIVGGEATAYALLANGTIRAWGRNDVGQVGDGTTGATSTPVTVAGITTATQITASLKTAHALLSDGSIRSWGSNQYLQIGDGTSVNRPYPVVVAGISTATQITAGYQNAAARLSDGSIRAWGFNNQGQLGDGTNTGRSTPVTVSGIATATTVTCIGLSTYAQLTDGTVRAWGTNSSGQLGDGTTIDRNSPVTLQGAGNVASIAPSSFTLSALLIRGASSTVLVTTPNMQVPAVGSTVVTAVVRDASGTPLPGQTVSFATPSGTNLSPSTATTNASGVATSTLVTNDTWATPGSLINVTATSNGTIGAAALTVLGANAYLIGQNRAGVAPGGISLTAPTQLALVFPSPIKAMATITPTISSTFALLEDGSVWSIGANNSGQLGDGTTTARTTWAQIPGLSKVVQIVAMGEGTVLALLADGTVRGWGRNGTGQLNDGTTTDRLTPTTINGLGTVSIQQLAGSYSTAYALLSDGTIRAWGSNLVGQIGNGTTGTTSAPATVSGITTATQIAASMNSAYALLSNGTIRSWGWNPVGQLGNGTTTSSSIPVTVSGIGSAAQLTAGGYSATARLTDGTVRAWGAARLGDGTNNNSSVPVTVSGIPTAKQVTTVGQSTYAQLSDGTICGWGQNGWGQLGDGTTVNRDAPVTLQGATNVSSISTSHDASSTLLIR